MEETELERIIDLPKLGYEFRDKPVIVGGLAMEYYGLRKHGDDVDFIVTERDYQSLKLKFPDNRKLACSSMALNCFAAFTSLITPTIHSEQSNSTNTR